MPASIIYRISDASHHNFPLYGLNFQHSVRKDLRMDVPSLIEEKVLSFDELISEMNKDSKPSVFVTKNEAAFTEFKNKNLTCRDITLESSRTFIASCQ
jgi:hypothetical protein